MAGRKAQTRRPKPVARTSHDFNYALDYKKIDFRQTPDVYRVGRGEQGVLMVEPYKSEILPFWKFKTPTEARRSALTISKFFRAYRRQKDLIGMDMARKFLQMGYTRARRYANHRSGRKYDRDGKMLPIETDPIKAKSAEIFYEFWQKVEADKIYAQMKKTWKTERG